MRIIAFIILIVIAFTLPIWFLCLCALIYAFRYTAYEIIVIGACVDALVGTGALALVYLFSMAGIFLVVEFLKPSLSFYEQNL